MRVPPIIEERNVLKLHSLFPLFKTVGFLLDPNFTSHIKYNQSLIRAEGLEQRVWNRGSGTEGLDGAGLTVAENWSKS